MEYEHDGFDGENRKQPFPPEQPSVVVVNEGGPLVEDDDDQAGNLDLGVGSSQTLQRIETSPMAEEQRINEPTGDQKLVSADPTLARERSQEVLSTGSRSGELREVPLEQPPARAAATVAEHQTTNPLQSSDVEISGRPLEVGTDGKRTSVFVNKPNWRTTGAEVKHECSKYGRVKRTCIKLNREYCRVEFYDAASAAACKEKMDGHVFANKPCKVSWGRDKGDSTGRQQNEKSSKKKARISGIVVPPFPPALDRPRFPGFVYRPPLSGVPYDPSSPVGMVDGMLGAAPGRVNPAFVPLHGSERYIGVDAWCLDPPFVGGSHERGGSTSNASTLREHSASVAAAQVGAQGVAVRREGNMNPHHKNGREGGITVVMIMTVA